MKNKFFVLALPRSRTYWLSKFLSTESCEVEHDGSMNYRSIEEMIDNMPDGNCDTALALHWEKLQGKVVVIDRDLEECIMSCKKLNIEIDEIFMSKIALSLKAASEVHPVVPYNDLSYENTCKWIFEYLTGEVFDRDHWLKFNETKIEVLPFRHIEKMYQKRENIMAMYGEFL